MTKEDVLTKLKEIAKGDPKPSISFRYLRLKLDISYEELEKHLEELEKNKAIVQYIYPDRDVFTLVFKNQMASNAQPS